MKTAKNISEVVKNGLCIGCGACTLACDLSAISIEYSNFHGNYLAAVNQDRCISCSTCLNVCFGFTTDISFSKGYQEYMDEIQSPPLDSFSGFAVDRKIRWKSSSGGVISATLRFLLNEGHITKAVVAKSKPGYPPITHFTIASSVDELDSTQGTKYCPVRIDIALKQMTKNQIYGIVALPCQVFAIQKLMDLGRIKGTIGIIIGLICGGAPTYNGLELILRNRDVDTNQITHIQFRTNGWPGSMIIKSTDNSSISEIPVADYWPIISPWFHMKRCMTCMSGLNPRSDLVCGDYWDPNIIRTDDKGTSLILCRNEKAIEIINKLIMNNFLTANRIDYSEATKTQVGIAKEKPEVFPLRLRFLRNIRQRHVYEGMRIKTVASIRFPNILNELLLLFGRFLASKRQLWRFFTLYHGGLQRLFRKDTQ